MPDKFLEKIQVSRVMCRPDPGRHLSHHEVGGGAPRSELRGLELHEADGGDPGV